MEDTESEITVDHLSIRSNRCSELDPMEDTERGQERMEAAFGQPGAANSIRWRILKAVPSKAPSRRATRCSELDPMEDTERRLSEILAHRIKAGAANSIRWRILKVE